MPPERKRQKTKFSAHYFDLPSDSDDSNLSEEDAPSSAAHKEPSSISQETLAQEPEAEDGNSKPEQFTSESKEPTEELISSEEEIESSHEPEAYSDDVQVVSPSPPTPDLPTKAHITLSQPFVDLTVSSEAPLPSVGLPPSDDVIDLLSSEDETPEDVGPKPVLISFKSTYPGHESAGEYTQPSDTLLSTLFRKFPLDAVVTFDNHQIYSFSTPQTLGNGDRLELVVMNQDQYDEIVKAAEDSDGGDADVSLLPTSEIDVAPSEDSEFFGIQINFKDNKSFRLLVSAETPFEKLAAHILSRKQLTADDLVEPIVLKFDDEPLDFSETVGDTEIEEGDIIEAHFTTKAENAV